MSKTNILNIQTQLRKISKTNIVHILTLAVIFTITFSIPVHAKFGEDLFKETSNGIYDMIALITSYIVTPIAVISLIILIIQIIWGMISGETHSLGKKIGWAFAILILVIVAFYLGNNARTVFNK